MSVKDENYIQANASLSIYDLDNTLVQGNTLEDFILFFITYKIKNKILLHFILFSLKIRIFFLTKLFRSSKLPLLIKQLNGVSKSEVYMIGNQYVNSKIKFNESILNELENDKTNNEIVYIISGTINEILTPILNKLQISGYSSELLYVNEICQGKLSVDLRGRKKIKVDEILDSNKSIDLSKSKFTTDNLEDQPLSILFGIIVAVVLNAKNKKFWEKYTKIIIDLGSRITLNNLHYFIPGYYYFKERTNFFIFFERIFFIFFVLIIANKINFFPISLLIWISYITLYEIGYIDNDFYAIRGEINPSIRLSEKVTSSHVFKFIIIRAFYFGIFATLMYDILNFDTYIIYISINISVLLVFLIHNRLPREKRVLTYSILKLSHFYIPLFTSVGLYYLMVSLFLFYLPNHLLTYLKKFKTNKFYLNSFSILVIQTILFLFILTFNYQNKEFTLISTYLFVTQNIVLFSTGKKLFNN
jgi:phosphoserine phosphatase